MKVNLNSLKKFNKKRSYFSRMITVCMLLVTCTMNRAIPVQAAPDHRYDDSSERAYTGRV